ncbi:hypothetical protein HOY82DRAFT_652094 [Tuber indicum]|nr:hypothetical protein HOY82DRAFT_652094 [Tuber indicum]
MRLVEDYHDGGENPLWVPRPGFPGCYMSVPEKIVSRIIFFLPDSPPFPDSSTVIDKPTLFHLSHTNRWFRGLLRNDVLSRVSVNSPKSLYELVNHLSTFSWRGQERAIRSLTLRWSQSVPFLDSLIETTTLDRREKANCVTTDLQCLLWKYTDGLQEIYLDFPGAMACFEDAVLSLSSPLKRRALKHITIRNGNNPIFPNARFLLCGISYLASDTLQVLRIDGGSPVMEGPWASNKPGLTFRIPDDNSFIRYKILSKLKHIEVRNLAGFEDSHLVWLCSSRDLRPRRRVWSKIHRGHTLVLDSNPHLTQTGIVTILKLIGDGLETLNLTHLVLEKMPGHTPPVKNNLWRPSCWPIPPTAFEDKSRGTERVQEEEHFCDVIREHCKGLRRLEIYTHSVCRNIFFPTPDILPPPPYREGETRFGVVSLRLPSREGGVESTLCRGTSGGGGVGLCLVADEAVEKGAVDEFVRVRGFWKGVSKFKLNRSRVCNH